MNLSPGTRVGGYAVEHLIGRGGMGAVYRARDGAGRAVALKVFVDDIARDERLASRFRLEARAGAAVAHPNVAAVLDSGQQGNVAFLALELLPGGSLAELVAREGRLPWRRAAELGVAIARGLAAVHAAGLVHRDLKPANVLLDGAGVPKLTDFGLVGRAPGGGLAATQALTRTGEVVGTYEYLAPEQADAARAVDARADLYALGGLLHFLLAGEPPFSGSGLALLRKHLEEMPRRVRTRAPDVPPALEALVLRLLEKDPAARPATAREVERSLEEVLAARPARPRRIAAVACVAGLPLAVALGAAAWTVLRPTPQQPPARPAPERPPPAAEPARKRARLTGALRSERFAEADALSAFAASADLSRAVSFGRSGRLLLWDLEAGTSRVLADGLPKQRVAISPDGRWILSGARGVDVRDATTGERVRTLPHEGDAPWLAFAPGGDLAVSAGGEVCVWSVPAWTRELRLATRDATCAAIGSGVLVVGHRDGRVRKLTLPAEEPAVTYLHGAPVTAVALDPEDGNRVLSVANDGSIVFWNGAERLPVGGRGIEARFVAFLPGDRVLSAALDGAVRTWSLATRGEVARFVPNAPGYNDTTIALASDRRRAASAGWEGTVHVWDVDTHLERCGPSGARGHATSVACTPDGKRWLAGSRDGRVRLVDLDRGEVAGVLEPALPGRVGAVAALDRRTIAAASNEGVGLALWDLDTRARTATLDPDAAGIATLDAGSGTFLAASGGRVVLRDAGGRVLGSVSLERASAARFAPNGRSAFVAAESGVHRLDLSPLALRQRVAPGPAFALAVLRGERLLVGRGDRFAYLVDPGGRETPLGPHGGDEVVGAVAAAPGGKVVATAAHGDPLLRLWGAETGQLLETIDLAPDWAFSLAFAPVGRTLVVGTARGAVLRYEVP